MAVKNLDLGVKIVNHKGLIGQVTAIESSQITVLLEDGTYKTLTKAIVARWWKDYEVSEVPMEEVAITIDESPQVEEVAEEVAEEVVEEIVEEVVAETPVKVEKTEEEIALEKAEKERLKKEREAERKIQLQQQKERLAEMRDWIVFSILEKYPELEMKTNEVYVAVKFMNRVTMEIHYRGDCNKIYILPQGEDFVESTLFNRKDGSKSWIVRQGYEVPVQQNDEVQAEILRLFEASKKLVEEKELAKEQERLRKKAEKQAKKEIKTAEQLKKAQAKKDKKRLEEIAKAKAEEEAKAEVVEAEEVLCDIPQEEAPCEEVVLEEEAEEIF